MKIKDEYISKGTQQKIEEKTIELMEEMEDNIPYLIAKTNVIHMALIYSEHEYYTKKTDYEIKFNQLVLGETYTKKFKTIKAREQQATIDLKKYKTELQDIKTRIGVYKAEIEMLKHELEWRLTQCK